MTDQHQPSPPNHPKRSFVCQVAEVLYPALVALLVVVMLIVFSAPAGAQESTTCMLLHPGTPRPVGTAYPGPLPVDGIDLDEYQEKVEAHRERERDAIAAWDAAYRAYEFCDQEEADRLRIERENEEKQREVELLEAIVSLSEPDQEHKADPVRGQDQTEPVPAPASAPESSPAPVAEASSSETLIDWTEAFWGMPFEAVMLQRISGIA